MISCAAHLRKFTFWFFSRLYLHRDAALQFELQLDHVHFLAGAELDQLRRPCLHLIYGHIYRLKLHLLLSHHLHPLLNIWESVGS